jgi:tetratricopeptide (TPR) repeat protein
MTDHTEPRLSDIREAYCDRLPALAVELAKVFLGRYPTSATARVFMGMALRDMRRFDEARWAFDDGLMLYPDEDPAWIYIQIARFHEMRLDYLEAEYWYRKAIEAEPRDAGHRIFLGGMLARLGRLDEAEAEHRDATGCIDGAVDEAYLNLGLVLRAQERYVEAFDCFRRAIALDPNYKAAKRALKDVKRVIAFIEKSA